MFSEKIGNSEKDKSGGDKYLLNLIQKNKKSRECFFIARTLKIEERSITIYLITH